MFAAKDHIDMHTQAMEQKRQMQEVLQGIQGMMAAAGNGIAGANQDPIAGLLQTMGGGGGAPGGAPPGTGGTPPQQPMM